MTKTPLGIAASLAIVALTACSGHSVTTPTAPTATMASSMNSALVASGIMSFRPATLTFPSQADPADFFSQLEVKYRSRPNTSSRNTPVDGLGYAVWIADYLRYRLSGCSHPDAASKTLTEIRTTLAGTPQIPPECGSSAGFPPQNEPVDFLQQMETTYRTQRPQAASSTTVDQVGVAVWMTDYLRYRLNAGRCSHPESVSKVFAKIDSVDANRPIDPPECPAPVTTPPAGRPVRLLLREQLPRR